MSDHEAFRKSAMELSAHEVEKLMKKAESARLRDDAKTEMTQKPAAEVSASETERRVEEAESVRPRNDAKTTTEPSASEVEKLMEVGDSV